MKKAPRVKASVSPRERERTVVFLGPTLPHHEAKKLLRADFRPPARQGDVFRALETKPDTIVLIDGVFESAPSVWHHELLAAHASGVTLLGSSSMGALRAAELPGVITPIGEIARRFVTGEWNDDAAVALLHADATQHYRALTVPWVNVFATARAAQRNGVLTAARARALHTTAEAQFYQSRTWSSVFQALGWPVELHQQVLAHAVDLKAADARACLEAAAQLAPASRTPEALPLSSFVRRTRLTGRLNAAPANEGVKTLLLADFARQAGIEPNPESVARWRRRLSGPFAEDQLAAWAEALALEELVLSAPEQFVADGPSHLEGAALQSALHQRR
ncbi:MAG: TfuA-like protein [Archangium sp.]|nr:TfuA-like protein [Archangium sp.]MDP3572784.1 TfuA-like protein [Archangium sp.]